MANYRDVYSLDQIVNQLVLNTDTNGLKYTELWNQSAITFSINAGVPTNAIRLPEGKDWVAMTSLQIETAKLSFLLWGDLINKTLQLTTSKDANITFNYSASTKDDGTYCRSNTSDLGPTSVKIDNARIWLSSTWATNADSGMAIGNYGESTMVHEIGHALGLNHPGSYNAAPGITFDYYTNAEFSQDTRQYSVMSYFGGYLDGVGWQNTEKQSTETVKYVYYYPQTPMVYDIAAIQKLCGVNMTTRTGDTVYGFNCNFASSDPERAIYDFNLNKHPIFTIWDAGGNNTIDGSLCTSAQAINLTPGSYSNVDGMTQNIAIAFNCKIQNAVGGSGNDSLTAGNLAPVCTLKGNVGNDSIFGCQKVVTISIYQGIKADYSIAGNESSSTVQDRQSNRDGSDTLTFVQRDQFADKAFALDVAKGENGGEAYRIYQAAFNRTPDASGLGYWMSSLDNGASLTSVAASFLNSAEFMKAHPNLSNADFVDLMYQNVLHRAGDAGGVAYWTDSLNTGANTRTTVLVGFSESNENVAQVAKIIGSGFDYQMYVGA